MSAPSLIILVYLGLWVLGGLLLLLPFSTYEGIAPVDAFFTSASAITLTGLTVKSTAEDFTTFGKIVIISLIQVSGLGIVSFFLFISYLRSKRVIDITYRRVFSTLFGAEKISIRKLVFFVVVLTFIVELLGAVLLYMSGYFPNFFSAFFHSTSAFCHAGFDVTGKSLIDAPLFVVGVHGAIILLSSLGAPTLFELMSKAMNKLSISGKKKDEESDEKLYRLSTHSRVVIWTTFSLLVAQVFLSIQFLGWRNIHHALFLSVSSRTAGFSTVDISGFPSALLLLFSFFMFIGASPGSSGGGIRTVTFATIITFIAKQLRGYRYTTLFKRRVPEERVRMALAFSIACFSVIFISFFFLLIAEGDRVNPMHLFFEVVSAFATVGLSTGITPNLTPASKIILILTMLLGKIGIINIFYSIYYAEKKVEIKYVEEDIVLP